MADPLRGVGATTLTEELSVVVLAKDHDGIVHIKMKDKRKKGRR